VVPGAGTAAPDGSTAAPDGGAVGPRAPDAAAGAGGAAGGSSASDASAWTGAGDAGDASSAADGATAAMAADLCRLLPHGSVSSCGMDSTGQPSQSGYLEIVGADGSHRYVCGTVWAPGGVGTYYYASPDQFMSDPQSCCGMPATPLAAPMALPTPFGYLGALHAPADMKGHETSPAGAGPIRQDPFALVLTDASGGAALPAALAQWRSWAGDGLPHPAPDGTGGYYFAAGFVVNYTILETDSGALIAVVGPEVSLTPDLSTPLGHPTLGACAAGGGAPLVLIAGEISGTTVSNHSGRFGHDPSVTPEALGNAATLLNSYGIPITATRYYAP
jgi:hypothetical protein